MRVIALAVRCVLGSVLGSAPGLSLIGLGLADQGLGIAIIGGVLGLLLALASVLYGMSARETLCRGGLLFVRLTIERNIPGAGRIVPIESRDISSVNSEHRADPNLLDARLCLGWKVGIVCAVIPGILIAIYFPQDIDPQPEPMILIVMKQAVIGFGFVGLVGGIGGAAIAALSLRGVHRRNIIAGAVVGVVIGSGLATAILPGAKPPAWPIYAFCCGGFGWVGMIFGLFNSENFAGNDSQTDADPTDKSQID